MADWYVFLHLVFVFLLLAGEGILAAVGISLPKANGHVATVLRLSSMSSFTGRVIMRAGAVGLLVFGILAAIEKNYSLGSTWISISFVLWLLAVAIAEIVLNPAERRLHGKAKELHDQGVERSDELHAAASNPKVAILGNVELLIVLTFLVLMVWRPGSEFT